MVPKSYKRSIIQCFFYRIYRACSSWKKIHESLIKAKGILERNQYPPNFYKPIISATIKKIVKPCIEKVNNDDGNNENLPAKSSNTTSCNVTKTEDIPSIFETKSKGRAQE